MMESNNCLFCSIVKNGSDLISNTVLYEDDDFFIIPAVGAFISGYVLILSKEHLYSMCYLSIEKKIKLQNIISKLTSIYEAKYGYAPLFFEHGASYDCPNLSGCCLVHAHIHVVPHRFGIMENMKTVLGLEEVNSIDKFYAESLNKPYLFFINNDKKIFFKAFSEVVMPSQVFRKWIAKDIGIATEWDWRIHRFNKNIYKTVIAIGNILYNINLSDVNSKLHKIYYARAMDCLNDEEIILEYDIVGKRLKENGMLLVNPFFARNASLALNKNSGKLIAQDNWRSMDEADCVVINLSKKGHMYIGCIDEMVNADMRGHFVIVIVGEAGADKHYYTHMRSDLIVKTLEDALSFLVQRNTKDCCAHAELAVLEQSL